MSIWKFSNPNLFVQWSSKVIPLAGVLTIVLLVLGLGWGVFFTPEDYRQGSAVKIIFIHVPSAFLAVNIYLMMFVPPSMIG